MEEYNPISTISEVTLCAVPAFTNLTITVSILSKISNIMYFSIH